MLDIVRPTIRTDLNKKKKSQEKVKGNKSTRKGEERVPASKGKGKG